MPPLRELQGRFLAGIFDPEDERIADRIRPQGLSAARRLKVYRNNVYSSLSGALRAVYPVVERLVGPGFFDYAAHEFVTAVPSRSGDIQQYGGEFPGFLASFDPAGSLPYLADVARLEWAYHEAFHAADARPFDPAGLRNVRPDDLETLTAEVHPAVRLIASPYPVLRIWEANRSEDGESASVSLDEGPAHVLIVRPALEVELRVLSAAQFALAQALQRGATLDAAVARALSLEPAFDLATFLMRLAETRFLVEFHRPDTPKENVHVVV